MGFNRRKMEAQRAAAAVARMGVSPLIGISPMLLLNNTRLHRSTAFEI
jgi:hypothetical protein